MHELCSSSPLVDNTQSCFDLDVAKSCTLTMLVHTTKLLGLLPAAGKKSSRSLGSSNCVHERCKTAALVFTRALQNRRYHLPTVESYNKTYVLNQVRLIAKSILRPNLKIPRLYSE